MLCYHDEQKMIPLLQNISSLQAQVKVLPDKIKPGNHDSLRNQIDTCYFKLGILNLQLTGSIPEGHASLNDELQGLFGMLEGTDVQPTSQCIAQVNSAHARFEKQWPNWETLQKELKQLNTLLKAQGMNEVKWQQL